MLVPSTTLTPFVARRKCGEVLTTLQHSVHTFYLAGSFYFKAASPSSDVDFYVEYSQEAHDFLRSNGFAIMGANADYPNEIAPPSEYSGNTVAIYQHATLPVQVQAFVNLPLALQTRDILAKVFPSEHAATRGPNRHSMWQQAETCARAIAKLTSTAA